MAIETDADRLEFFDADEFGVVAIYDGSVSVSGLFENEFLGVDIGAAVPIESTRPVFTCRASDVSGITHGKIVLINTVTYTVQGVEIDGTGIVKLVLEKQ